MTETINFTNTKGDIVEVNPKYITELIDNSDVKAITKWISTLFFIKFCELFDYIDEFVSKPETEIQASKLLLFFLLVAVVVEEYPLKYPSGPAVDNEESFPNMLTRKSQDQGDYLREKQDFLTRIAKEIDK